MNPHWSAAVSRWGSLRQQWEDSVVLRLGSFAILGVCWLNFLWWQQDQGAARAKEIVGLEAEIARMRQLKSGPDWSVRAKDALSRVEALDSMAWPQPTPGLAQAAFQDWLNQAASKAGLTVRELRLMSGEGNATRAVNPPSAGASVPGAPTSSRARLVVDFKPQGLATLLQDMATSPQAIMVDRLQIRTWMQPPQVDLDVRIEARKAKATP